MKKIKGITIEINGNAQGFSEAIGDVEKQLRGTQKTLRAVNKQLKLDPKNTELLAEKQKLLSDSIKTTEAKLDALKQAQKSLDTDMAKGINIDKEAYESLRKEIMFTESNLSVLEKQADEVKKELSDTADIGKKKFRLFSKEAKKASNSVEETGDSAEKAGKGGFTILKGALANLVSSGFQVVIGKAKNLISTIWNLSAETQEYREDIGKLETAYKSAGKSTELATQTYKNFYSVLGEEDRSVEAVNHLAKFVSTEKDMQKWTNICTGVWGTFGDSLPIEGLTEASNETAKVGKVTGVLADALNWAGVSEDDFQAKLDKCNNERERTKLITETLNGLYSTAAEKYRETNQSIIDSRKASSDYNDTMASLGETLEPLQTQITEFKTKLAEELAPQVENFSQQIQEFLESQKGQELISNLSNLLINLVSGMARVVAFISENKELVVVALTAITAAVIAFKIATIAANAALWASPITWIIAGIMAIIAGVVLLIKNWDKIKVCMAAVWASIKSTLSNAYEWIKKIFKSIVNFGIDMLNGILGGVEWLINKIISALNWGIDKINKLLGGISDVLEYIGIDFNIQVGSIEEVSIPRIPKLWKGGIVPDGASAIVGDNGAETLTVQGGKAYVTPINSVASSKTGLGNIDINIGTVNNYDTDTDINTLAETVAFKIDLKTRQVARANG